MMTVTMRKCPCGHPSCNQYTLSTQKSVGFELADAKLYTAASDLLAALQMALDELDGNSAKDWGNQARAAIAKATSA